jgi:CxxC motif-containing protein
VEEREGVIAVAGNRCRRGIDFARAELTNPTRTVTTTVRTGFPGTPVLPVRTDGEIPKGKIRELMDFLKTVTVTRPLKAGDVVVENILGLGCNIISTDRILIQGEYKTDGC